MDLLYFYILLILIPVPVYSNAKGPLGEAVIIHVYKSPSASTTTRSCIFVLGVVPAIKVAAAGRLCMSGEAFGCTTTVRFP